MENLKKSAIILSLLAGIIGTTVSFVAYWVFFALSKSGGSNIGRITPMVILFAGILGGILAIIGAVLIKSTKLAGAILCGVAMVLLVFATLFLILKMGGNSEDAVMFILPFFVVPDALIVAGGVLALITAFKKDPDQQ